MLERLPFDMIFRVAPQYRWRLGSNFVNLQRVAERELAKLLMKANVLGNADRPEELNLLLATGHVQTRQQARQAEKMIAVQMRDKNITQLTRPQVRFAKLHLRAFAAIKEKNFALPNDGRAGKIALIDRRRRTGAEENDFDHELKYSRILGNGQEDFYAASSQLPLENECYSERIPAGVAFLNQAMCLTIRNTASVGCFQHDMIVVHR
jgi:hypothetical protein